MNKKFFQKQQITFEINDGSKGFFSKFCIVKLFILNNRGPPTTLQLGLGHHLQSHCLHAKLFTRCRR